MSFYRAAGVDVEAGDRLVTSIGPAVTSTWGDHVVGSFGGFAAGLRVPSGYRQPVLMMSADGVGTKIDVAVRAGRLDGLGFDLVAMCVDDLAAVGAQAIGFTDYVATGRLDPHREQILIASIAAACNHAGCALLGGETAEHPGIMTAAQFDLAGSALGIVEEDGIFDGSRIEVGDSIIGLASPNLRSNGFSLVRTLFDLDRLDEPFPGDDRSAGEVLVEPSVIYAPAVLDVAADKGVTGFAHITGGGLPGNAGRPLPSHLTAEINVDRWDVPNAFSVIARLGSIPPEDMYHTFNMGVGFVVYVRPDATTEVVTRLEAHGHPAQVIGRVVPFTGRSVELPRVID